MKNITILIFISLLFVACENEEKTEIKTSEIKHISAPDFNSDSAFFQVEKQVKFGPRVPNTKAHQECAKYLANTIRKFADTIYIQQFNATAYDGTTLKAKNIIAEFNSDKTNRILLFAHWDSRPYADHSENEKDWNTPIDGANDGASGVGVLLEIARNLKSKMPNIGVDIWHFRFEDYGQAEFKNLPYKENTWCLGSQYWAKNKHIPGYYAKYGILLDMVGAKNATFSKEENSVNYASSIVEKVWKAADKTGFSNYFVDLRMPAITDDHYYINTMANIPSIDIIHHDVSSETGFCKTWHTPNDNLQNIDKQTLKAVGQTLLEVIYNEN